MLPPGLALLSLSEAAWDKVRRVGPSNFYFNLLAERDKSLNNQTLFTSPVNLLRGLAVSLDLFRDATMEGVYRKQWALTAMARTGAASMGLELLAKTNFTWGLTSILLPAGVDGSVVLKAAVDRCGVVMAGGQGELKKKSVRLGHMGHVDWSDVLAGLHALKTGLVAAGGYCAARNYMEDAMHAYEEALEEGYPGA
jgi:aspartate aminotransferase-like enzyme